MVDFSKKLQVIKNNSIDLDGLKDLDAPINNEPERDWTEGLKGKQVDAFTLMSSYIQGSVDCEAVVLRGYAGTGKSYTINRLRDWYLSITKYGNIIIMAPTNKAVKVIQSMEEEKNLRVKYCTCHSGLGLKQDYDKDGALIFKKDTRPGQTYAPPITDAAIVLLDESSMLDDTLHGYLQEEKERNPDLKIIYIGDPMQCPPVNHNQSVPMDDEKCEELDMQIIELTEVVRQAADNPIIAFSMELRKQRYRPTLVLDRESSENEKGEGIEFVDSIRPEDLHDIMIPLFASEEFRKDADHAKVMAWTNVMVNKFNKYIRKQIYGQDVAKLVIGEKLVADTPIFDVNDEDNIIFPTSAEFEVKSFEIAHAQVSKRELKYYKVKVEYYVPYTRTFKTEMINVIHEDSDMIYKDLMKERFKIANELPYGSKQKRQAWEVYWGLKKYFAAVKYNYAITCHKCQGSTYKYALVINQDISRNPQAEDRNKLRYTAATRPTHKVYIAG